MQQMQQGSCMLWTAMTRPLFRHAEDEVLKALVYLLSSPVKSSTPPRYLHRRAVYLTGTSSSAVLHKLVGSKGGTHSSRSTFSSSPGEMTRPSIRKSWKHLASAYYSEPCLC